MNQYKTGPWLVTLAALLWAVDAPFRKFLTQDLSSTTIVFMEHIVIAVLVVWFLFPYLVELKKLNKKEWLSVVFIAFGGSALATIFFTQSFSYVNPSVAILLQKIQPFFAILLASIVLRERMHKYFWLWALLAIFGGYLVSFPDFKVEGLQIRDQLGVVFAVAAAFFWGGSTVFGRYVLRRVSFQAMTAVRFLSALLFLALIQIYYRRLGEVGNASDRDWLYVLIIAVIAGFVSLFIYYRGLRSTKASIATLCELAFPVAAVVVNWFTIPGAELKLGQIVGGLILLVSVVGLSFVNEKESAILETNAAHEAVPANQ